jgi:hypothetical protein
VSAKITRHFTSTGRVTNHNGVLEIEMLKESGDIVGVRVHVIAVPRLR